MTGFHQPQRHAWDDAAQAAYLSIDHPGSAEDKFISCDDTATCLAKVRYVTERALGGVMIFELGGGKPQYHSLTAHSWVGLSPIRKKLQEA